MGKKELIYFVPESKEVGEEISYIPLIRRDMFFLVGVPVVGILDTFEERVDRVEDFLDRLPERKVGRFLEELEEDLHVG